MVDDSWRKTGDDGWTKVGVTPDDKWRGLSQTAVISAALSFTWSQETPTLIKSSTEKPAAQVYTWSQATPTINYDFVVDVTSSLTITWLQQDIVHTVDSFVSTDDDTWVDTGVDFWRGSGIEHTIVSPSVQVFTWSQSTPNIYLSTKAKPSSQIYTWSTQAPIIAISPTVELSVQTFTWSLNSPTISAQKDIEISPAAQTWTWSQHAPLLGYAVTVYIGNILRTEGGEAILDEGDNPINLEKPIGDWTITWSQEDPTISTEVTTTVAVAAQTFTWSQQTSISVILNPIAYPDAQTYTWSIETPDVTFDFVVTVNAQTYTWSYEAITIDIGGESIVFPLYQTWTWSQETPTPLTPAIKRKERGLLLGVY